MKRIIAAAALLAAAAAWAQNVVTISPAAPVLDTAPDVYRSTTKIGSNAASLQACIDAIKVDAAARAPGTYAYSCRPGITSITATVAALPPCPSKPADETRSQACPSGTSGLWVQTRTYASAPAPTCWAAGEWLPVSAPSVECSAAPTPVGALGVWSHAQAGTTDGPQFAPEVSVYPNGAGITFSRNGIVNRTDATGPADGSVFEFHPAFALAAGDVLRATWTDKSGTARSSELVIGGSVPPTPPPAPPPPPPPPPTTTGSAALQWDAVPDARVIGYRVYFGTAPRSYSQAYGAGVLVTGTTYTVPALAAGATYYFAVTAVAEGLESGYSNEASKAIP